MLGKQRIKKYFAYIVLSFSLLNSSISCAEDFKKHSLTFLSAIGSYESIDLLLKKTKLISPYSYFIGVGYRSHEIIFDYIKLNVELMKHVGKQQSFELTMYPSIESPEVYLRNIGFNWE